MGAVSWSRMPASHAVRGLRRASRSMSDVAHTASGSSEIAAFRPKIQVTRHLAPFEQEIITPPAKFFKHQAAMWQENAPEWIPGALVLFGSMTVGDYYFDKWSREHATHEGHDEEE